MNTQPKNGRPKQQSGEIAQQRVEAAERRKPGGHQDERRPSPVEERRWRGDGIVGDRHTD